MAMAESENSERLIEVLREIRDELRALRIELGARGGRMPSGIRAGLVNRGGRWRGPALAAAGVAGLALVLGLALRDRPASPAATVAVAPQMSPTPAKSSPPALIPAPAVSPAQAPLVMPAPVTAHPALPFAKTPAAAPAPATKSPAGAPTMAAPALAKERLKLDGASRAPVEAVSDDDETLAFPPPPRRVRVHRLSYGPVGSEPAKL
jgi:hypothetical protein